MSRNAGFLTIYSRPPLHSVVPRIASLVHSFLNIFTAIFLILQISWKEEPSMFCRHFFGGYCSTKKNQMQYYSCMSSVNEVCVAYIGIIIYLLSMSCDLSIWHVYQITFCQTWPPTQTQKTEIFGEDKK